MLHIAHAALKRFLQIALPRLGPVVAARSTCTWHTVPPAHRRVSDLGVFHTSQRNKKPPGDMCVGRQRAFESSTPSRLWRKATKAMELATVALVAGAKASAASSRPRRRFIRPRHETASTWHAAHPDRRRISSVETRHDPHRRTPPDDMRVRGRILSLYELSSSRRSRKRPARTRSASYATRASRLRSLCFCHMAHRGPAMQMVE